MASFPPHSAVSTPAGSRIACCVEYDGAAYSGWQLQPQAGARTIQAEVENALGTVADTAVRVHCAGRTDAGVHACGQVIHFDTPVARALKAWVLGANTRLPDDIRIRWAAPVAEHFHARFTATSRRYRYIVCNTPVRPALLRGQVTWQRRQLDASLMHAEAQCLLGERDFSAFRAAACQSTSPMRNVDFITVARRGELIVVDIQANAFLHHMVRNIAGALMAVGSGVRDPGWLARLLASGDRTLGADTAAPDGLYLVDVAYPPQFDLPRVPLGPLLLSG